MSQSDQARSSREERKAPRRRWSGGTSRQRRATDDGARPLDRRQNPIRRWKSSASTLVQKLNVGQWIENLERDQELADKLEVANQEFQQEVARRELVATVKEECMNAVRVHLQDFLRSKCNSEESGTLSWSSSDSDDSPVATLAESRAPHITYEDWIAELHPDNYNPDARTIDPRFYVDDSDHRLLWNEYATTDESATDSMASQRLVLAFVPARGITVSNARV